VRPPSKDTLQSPGARLTLTMSAWFCAWGITTPFLPRWLEVERGLSGVEIGAVLASAQLVRIFTGPAIAAWADGFKDRRTPLRILIVATFAAYALFLLVAQGFWSLFFLCFACTTLGQAVGPLLEGAALRAGQDGRVPFGVARGIGSSFYILGNIGGGALVAAIGLIAVPVWTLGCLAIVLLAVTNLLSHDPAPEMGGGFRHRLKGGLAIARQPRFLLLFFGVGLILAGHAFYYGFSTIIWRAQGVPATTVGYLWAIGVAFEVALLFTLPRIERYLKPESLILIGGVASIVRWSGLAFAPTGAWLWPLQLLHALTFAPVHVGALRIIQRDAPEEHSLFLQTAHAALHGGILIGGAMLASGWLYDHVHAAGYWAMSALCVIGLLLMWRFRNATARAGEPARAA